MGTVEMGRDGDGRGGLWQVMDVADAAILTGVLERLFDAGWVLVATCNRVPADFESSHTHKEHPQAHLHPTHAASTPPIRLHAASTPHAAPRPTSGPLRRRDQGEVRAARARSLRRLPPRPRRRGRAKLLHAARR